MQLHELRSAVANTYAQDWNRIKDGPLGRLVPAHVTGHTAYAVLKSDLNISLAWGLEVDPREPGMHPRTNTYGWLASTGTEEAVPEVADLYVGATLADRITVLVADNGRVILPWPSGRSMDADEPQLYVTRWEHDFARLVDSFEHGDFRHYFGQTGIEII